VWIAGAAQKYSLCSCPIKQWRHQVGVHVVLWEVVLAALTQYEKQWWAELACFNERYETLVENHPDAKTEIPEQMWKKNCRGCRDSGLTGTLLGSRSGRAGFKDGAEVAILRRLPWRKRYTGIRKTPRKDEGLLRCSGRTTLRRRQCDRFPVLGLSPLYKAEILYHCYATSNLNRYIRGNECVPLLEPRQPSAERRIDPLLCSVKAQQTFHK
jgi:hypothetical protein